MRPQPQILLPLCSLWTFSRGDTLDLKTAGVFSACPVRFNVQNSFVTSSFSLSCTHSAIWGQFWILKEISGSQMKLSSGREMLKKFQKQSLIVFSSYCVCQKMKINQPKPSTSILLTGLALELPSSVCTTVLTFSFNCDV